MRSAAGPCDGVSAGGPYLQQPQLQQHLQPQLQPQPQLPLPPRTSQEHQNAAGEKSEGNVLLTLAKGIEALLQQNQSGRQDRPEAVKPGISELPQLAEYQPSTGSIDLLNWITHIGPIMEDLSDTSLAWWEATMKDVLQWYKSYSTSPPLVRLQLRPQPTHPLKPEWARVERRATAMLLSAVPRQVRDEVIAHGEVTSLSLLCKLYAVYQPGNLQEKSLILRMLEQPDECPTALAAVEALRKWNLWRRRAASIGIAEPDASILLRGLDRITGTVVRGNTELSFRVSLIRSTLQIDVCPSATSITSFVQHLQAEMEQQARLGAVKSGGDEAAVLKALDPSRGSGSLTNATPPPPPPSTSPTTPKPTFNLCRFFASDKGCRRGNGCKYPHTWSLVDKSARQKKCLHCGGQGHRVKECKAPGGGAAPPKGSAKAESVGPSDTGATSGSTPTSEASRRVNFNIGDVQAKVLSVLEDIKQSPLFGPVVASLGAWCKPDALSPSGNKKALLDSGATHPLRHPHDDGEWNKAKDVRVQLAGDSTMCMKQTSAGTLLSTQDVSQVIVPLGKVITTLGYQLSWTARSCDLIGPDNEVLPLEVRNGCPEVSEAVAHKLIQQLEEQQLQELNSTTQMSMRALSMLRASWWTHMKEYVITGDVLQAQVAIDKALFLEFKDVVKTTMVQESSEHSAWDMMKVLSVNRRARKRLLRAEGWIVRWNPPASEQPKDHLRHLSYFGEKVYVNLNTILINNDFKDVWPVLQWAARNGRIDTVISRDSSATPIEQNAAAPHRSKLHYLHALASAARECVGGNAVKLFVEDQVRVTRWMGRSPDHEEDDWPPWTRCKDSRLYFEEMGLLDVSVPTYLGGKQVRIYKLSNEAAWRLHVARNHQPFRRDCSVCVRNSASGHQHRSTPHPMAYSLSVDVVGPLKGFGRSPDGKFFKYFVIGAFRVPQVEGSLGHGEVRGYPLPPDGVEDEEEKLSDDEEAEEPGDVPGCVGVPEEEVQKEEEQWKELMATFKRPIPTTTLYFAVPVNNKKAATMLPAVQRIVADVKALGYPVTRLHSDRGGEFRGNLVRRWALAQGMWPTTTSGSDSAANGVAESGVRYLKRRARILLDSASVAKENWPTAVQYAAAQQRSEQLGELPRMPVAYGTKVYVKTKRYKTGAVEDFGPHWTRGKYVGPSTDIRGGHVILKDTGTFIQTTHVRITQDPPPLEEVVPTVLVEPELPEEDPPIPPPLLPPPSRRVRAKGPAAAKLDLFFPKNEVMVDYATDSEVLEDEDPQVKYLRVGEIQYVEAIAKQLYQDSKYSEHDCTRLLTLFAGTCGNLRVPRAPLGIGMIFGAYVHGGSFGVTRYGRDLPWVASYFNEYLKRKLQKTHPELPCSWTTLAIQSAEDIPRHKDSHNERGTMNYVIELKTDSLDGLWVENHCGGRAVVGGEHPRDHQYEDGSGGVHDGCLVGVADEPAVFDPLIPHAYVKESKAKWFLSAYTPQGAYKLRAEDLNYLDSLGFPLGVEPSGTESFSRALETTPMLKRASLPSEGLQSGARDQGDEVEVLPAGDCEACFGEWAIYVPEVSTEQAEEEELVTSYVSLCKVCASDDPSSELPGLTRTVGMLSEEEVRSQHADDMEDNVEYWTALGLYEHPRVAKLEPEYTEGIEDIIEQAIHSGAPLRHTYNVSPKDTKPVIERWRPAIAKEVAVVEKGFKRITIQDVSGLKENHIVQELPSKLVYTVKPPAGDGLAEGEQSFCKRKARIVCCGNYAADDQGELYAGGAAAESLRCSLTYTARRKWRAGILDITGAFMLTPLPQGRGEVIYIIRPPAALIQLGLAHPDERWLLTHGMYGLRQSPKLWSSFRDQKLKAMVICAEGKEWVLKQGKAEPNMWMIYEAGGTTTIQEPEGLVLVYVDDILVCGPLWLVRAVSASIKSTWKASDLEMLEYDHEIRFLGCEIAASEDHDAIYIHQRPYITELLRHHATPETDLSPIQAPRDLVTFEAIGDEQPGTEDEIKRAQRACGELLWLAQRSRPDIAYVVCAMGSLLTRAAPRCLQIAQRLRSYLQRTQNLALTLKPDGTNFEIYTDSSFAPEGSRSHSGLVVVWLGAPICWRSGRQPFVCLSTAECELLAATEGLILARSIEAVICQLLPEVEANQLSVTYVAGQRQWADLLTKSFPRQRLEELIGIWGMIDVVAKVSKLAMIRVMVLCMMMQTSRAMSVEPLALDSSFELYVALAVAAMALVGAWEAFWYVWDRCCSDQGESRSSRRHRRLQEAVQRELATTTLDVGVQTEPVPMPRGEVE
ncbi:TY5A, partial [Symbiodinium sp. KB8]